ncbi:MAG: hypothetical protein R2864_02510 [Syntrophotaleaceae bacterium]
MCGSLRNVLERAFIETRSEAIGARAFREWVRELGFFRPWDRPVAENRARFMVMLPYDQPFPGGDRAARTARWWMSSTLQ